MRQNTQKCNALISRKFCDVNRKEALFFNIFHEMKIHMSTIWLFSKYSSSKLVPDNCRPKYGCKIPQMFKKYKWAQYFKCQDNVILNNGQKGSFSPWLYEVSSQKVLYSSCISSQWGVNGKKSLGDVRGRGQVDHLMKTQLGFFWPDQ